MNKFNYISGESIKEIEDRLNEEFRESYESIKAEREYEIQFNDWYKDRG